MILLFGGTTEGRIAARVIDEAGKPFYYSTKGDEQEIALQNGKRITGALNSKHMEEFCNVHTIRLLVDAAHPFAQELHQTVIEVAQKLELPLIRYERLYPVRSNKITWCIDYPDAMRKMEKEKINRLLALTGVNSIRKLKPFWEQYDSYFRILDRESSRKEAHSQNFPENKLLYYQQDYDDQALLNKLHPQAVLLKESGFSGGFAEKVNIALEAGVRVFALMHQSEKPPQKTIFYQVNGEYGLRLSIQKLLPDYYPLRIGISTGTCATAATLAAASIFFNPKKEVREVFVTLPNRETIAVPIEKISILPFTESNVKNQVLKTTASVIKDGGDDPDATHGLIIQAEFMWISHHTKIKNQEQPNTDCQNLKEEKSHQEVEIILRGGEGIGTVTLPGLGMKLGAPAINTAPRKMIEENLRNYISQVTPQNIYSQCVVTLSVPKGKEIAQRTFNPRLGIVDGISIIGTSGIVRPFSSEAFVNAIRKEMEVAKATGASCIVINSGAKSENAVRKRYSELPSQAFVHYGNFIGETLKIAAELNIPEITLGVMIGKAVKLAEGHLDTHSKKVVMNKEFLINTALQAGCSSDTISRISQITLARELWILLKEGEQKAFLSILLELCHKHCTPLFSNKLNILLIDEEGKIY